MYLAGDTILRENAVSCAFKVSLAIVPNCRQYILIFISNYSKLIKLLYYKLTI
jgi:hypothetical protein